MTGIRASCSVWTATAEVGATMRTVLLPPLPLFPLIDNPFPILVNRTVRTVVVELSAVVLLEMVRISVSVNWTRVGGDGRASSPEGQYTDTFRSAN